MHPRLASHMNGVIQRLRRAIRPRGATAEGDGKLLETFVQRRDEAAFAALVRSHGPMVLGVCRRILRDPHDAEDAFQATFLVLARKADTIVPRESVANWLYGVAQRTALKARGIRVKRWMRERQVSEMPEAAAASRDLWPEIEPILDQELGRLPEKYRTAIVLCGLEGRTQKEAAVRLGWTEGCVSMRLSRARKMLAQRLTRRGVKVTSGTIVALLTHNAASIGMSQTLFASTAKSAIVFATGQSVAAGIISTPVAALTDGVLKSMFYISFAKAVAVTALIVSLGAGAAGLTHQRLATKPATAAGLSAPPSSPDVPEVPRAVSAAEAQELAVRAHAQAAAIDKAPKFFIRGLDGAYDTEMMQNPAPDPLTNLFRALDESIGKKAEYEVAYTFAWDERHFLIGDQFFLTASDAKQPAANNPPADPHKYQFFWGTPNLSGLRSRTDQQPPYLVLRANAAETWKNLSFSSPNYVLATCHDFWWGDNRYPSHSYRSQCFNPIPPAAASYQSLGDEQFDGESCHVVVSPTRLERLWISPKTGLMRGYLQLAHDNVPSLFFKSAAVKEFTGRLFASNQEYQNWFYAEFDKLTPERKVQLLKAQAAALDFTKASPKLLVRFRDFREIAPGIWWPYREDRAQGYPLDGGFKCFHATFVVEELRTDLDLTERVNELKPKEGEQVRDLRYAAPVEYEYAPDITEAEILKRVDKQLQKQRENKGVSK